jgi:hypothetical protein
MDQQLGDSMAQDEGTSTDRAPRFRCGALPQLKFNPMESQLPGTALFYYRLTEVLVPFLVV